MLGKIKIRILELSLKEASFVQRGFPGCTSSSRWRLEHVIETFIQGYNLALRESDMVKLAHQIDTSFLPGFAGFAYEGAGLYFALNDLLVPGCGSRLGVFVGSAAKRHDFITMVGAGFAVARIPLGLRRLERYQRTLDPMNAWCLADGYGFHQGFFHWKRFIQGLEEAPRSLSLQNRRLFDAGVGRSMWWVFGADARAIASAISHFSNDRQPEMWAGIGTAIAYAGGDPPEALQRLLDLSGTHRSDLLSGIPLAAHMREKGGNPAEWTEEICLDLLGLSVAETSGLVVSELASYLDSWRGSEQEKWSRCYLALRDRIKRRLAHECPASPDSSGYAATEPRTSDLRRKEGYL